MECKFVDGEIDEKREKLEIDKYIEISGQCRSKPRYKNPVKSSLSPS